MSFVPSFSIGSTVTNEQLYKEFACGNMGGMRRSRVNNCLVIISDHTKSFYEDKWYGHELHYTGMGKNGDQTLLGNQNKTLAESRTNGICVHLFEVFEASKYIYIGPVQLCDTPYQENQADETGNPRKVWIFPLRVKHQDHISKKVLDCYTDKQKKKAAALSNTELKKKAQQHGAANAANRAVTTNVYVRNEFVAEYTKVCANGYCELCDQPAPFKDKDGQPYLESHHVVWLSLGGADVIENAVALCPNCHKKMHIVDDTSDKVKLLEKATTHLSY